MEMNPGSTMEWQWKALHWRTVRTLRLPHLAPPEVKASRGERIAAEMLVFVALSTNCGPNCSRRANSRNAAKA